MEKPDKIRPRDVVEAIDEIVGGSDFRLDNQEIITEGEKIFISGGVTFRESSRTGRAYTAIIPTEKGIVRLDAIKDSILGYSEISLARHRGHKSWEATSKSRPPKWARDALGTLGLKFTKRAKNK